MISFIRTASFCSLHDMCSWHDIHGKVPLKANGIFKINVNFAKYRDSIILCTYLEWYYSLQCTGTEIHLLVPYRLAGGLLMVGACRGTINLLAVRPSVRRSVCQSVCPSYFSFPDFCLSFFEILIWNLVYELVMT